jgi:hypothetical protein
MTDDKGATTDNDNDGASTNDVGVGREGKENSKGGQDGTQTGWAAFHFYEYFADPYHIVQDFVAKGELFF